MIKKKNFYLITKFSTPLGEITVTPLFHASIQIELNGIYIYIDPSLSFAPPNLDISYIT